MTLALANADTTPDTPTNGALTKTQIVDAILEMNGTARRDWLMSFDFCALKGYFLRLHHAFAPRGTAWDGLRTAESR